MEDLSLNESHFFHEHEVFDFFFVFKLGLANSFLEDRLMYLILHEKKVTNFGLLS